MGVWKNPLGDITKHTTDLENDTRMEQASKK